jgi:hypothetical protein
MSDCECLAGCPFFHDKMADMPSMAEMLKERYCKGDWQACARHQIFTEFGKGNVPTDLFPNQQDIAAEQLVALRVG